MPVSAKAAEGGLEVIGFSDEYWPLAVEAYRRFGRERHPAGLNFGDCLTYAVARLAGRPLLCLGNDFAKIDLELGSPPAGRRAAQAAEA
jgi:ribonuclease VapC